MEQKIGRILSDFSFTNFVGVRLNWILMLIYLSDSESRKTQSAHLWCALCRSRSTVVHSGKS